ncbi:MAG: response regulator [Desulfamplus sp.]|nr:response regulator [Desulfamplus sp.]
MEEQRTILCVDDEPDIVDALHDTFMDKYKVKTATSSKEALTIFKKADISLVISDQRMPEMTGVELMEQIHKIKPACKKILLTGYADIKASVDAINKGNVDKYLSKPWDDEELLDVVAHLLKIYKMDEFLLKIADDAVGMKNKLATTKDMLTSFNNFMDNSYTGMCVIDSDGKIVHINRIGLELLNYNDPSDIKGKPASELFIIDEKSKAGAIEQAIQKKASTQEILLQKKDGSKIKVMADIILKQDSICGFVIMQTTYSTRVGNIQKTLT